MTQENEMGADWPLNQLAEHALCLALGYGASGRDDVLAEYRDARAALTARISELEAALEVSRADARGEASTAARLNRLLGICHRLRWTDVGVLAAESTSTKDALADLAEMLFADGLDEALSAPMEQGGSDGLRG